MNENYLEIFNVRPERPVPVFVDTFSDWEQGARRAAREPFCEVVVYDDVNTDGIVVYSDDPDVHSGGWWHAAIRAERLRLGLTR